MASTPRAGVGSNQYASKGTSSARTPTRSDTAGVAAAATESDLEATAWAFDADPAAEEWRDVGVPHNEWRQWRDIVSNPVAARKIREYWGLADVQQMRLWAIAPNVMIAWGEWAESTDEIALWYEMGVQGPTEVQKLCDGLGMWDWDANDWQLACGRWGITPSDAVRLAKASTEAMDAARITQLTSDGVPGRYVYECVVNGKLNDPATIWTAWRSGLAGWVAARTSGMGDVLLMQRHLLRSAVGEEAWDAAAATCDLPADGT